MRAGILRTAMTVFVALASIGVVGPTAMADTCTFTIGNAERVYAGDDLQFPVTPSAGCAKGGSVTVVNHRPVAGGKYDARPGIDYDASGGTLSWDPGDLAPRNFPVPTKATKNKLDLEVQMCLTTAAADNCAVGLMSTPMCMLTGGPTTVSVSLSLPSSNRTIVHFSTHDGTAKEGKDYVGLHDVQVTIPPGGFEASVQLTPLRPTSCQQTGLFFDVDASGTVNGFKEQSFGRVSLVP
ncbi:Calx-beta domain-containing protein [Actinocrispum wychmicini]|uniref:Calx-beta domain-containing protein n=1 Tax=Actinocrispum wychmicini TaxID=1213861 RepID=A0A4R2J4S6_9PSEU|nr:Calx-beta domain-containing protein [Actinocrispum wychmicini]TCO53771.1 Calx-beta domain-containing protein [Actinocrispum wychmicini]